jgi:AraC-like DNA-binding protein/mannose-6-phosphate isomerase-like protein (cupin superfamily)
MKKRDFPVLQKEYMRNIRMVLADVEKYNENELFYKRCYELRSDPDAMDKYIASIDKKFFEDQKSIHPIKKDRPAITESYLFGEMKERNILLCKHDRYTPAFVHYHDYFEVFYVLSGQCVNSIGTECFPLPAGSLCFIAPYINHTMEVFDDSIVINICFRKTTFDNIFFNLLTSHNFLSFFFTSNLYPVDPVEYLVLDIGADINMIGAIYSMLIEQTRRDEYSNRIMENLVTMFFTLVARKEVKNQPFIGKMEQLRYISYINEHFRTVTLVDVAKQFNISTAHCSRLIKALTGKNFTELVRDIRLRHAQSILASTNVKVYDVSYSLGYKNQETFIRNFKKALGLSPNQYRNRTARRLD